MAFKYINNFKFWCQKVLPLVYDDSLSYYEVFCKMAEYLNAVIDNVNSLPEYIQSLVTDENLKDILSELLDELREQIAAANERENKNASEDRTIGEWVWLEGELYQITQNITAGTTYIPATNCTKITVEEVISNIEQTVSSVYESINNINTEISDLKNIINNGKIINVLNSEGNTFTEKLKQAISECPIHGTVYIPFGEYEITETIIVNKPIRILGGYYGFEIDNYNSYVTIEQYSTPLISCSLNIGLLLQCAGISVSNISIENNGIGDSPCVIKLDVSNTGARYGSIHGLQFNNVFVIGNNCQYGVYCPHNVLVSTFNNVRVYNSQYGIKIGYNNSVSTSVVFNNCWCVNNIISNYDLTNVKYSSFISCACDNSSCENGYVLTNCSNVKLIGCGAEGFNSSGVKLNSCTSIYVSVSTSLTSQITTSAGAFNISNCNFILFENSRNDTKTDTDLVSSQSTFDCLGCDFVFYSIDGSSYTIDGNFGWGPYWSLSYDNLTMHYVYLEKSFGKQVLTMQFEVKADTPQNMQVVGYRGPIKHGIVSGGASGGICSISATGEITFNTVLSAGTMYSAMLVL